LSDRFCHLAVEVALAVGGDACSVLVAVGLASGLAFAKIKGFLGPAMFGILGILF